MHRFPGIRAPPSFLTELVRHVRSTNPENPDGRTDFEVLEPFIARARRPEPGGVKGDPEVFWRIEIFYEAVGATVERRTGIPCSPMLRMHHEGYGRLVLLAGRLVVLDRHFREAGAFTFPTVEKLAEAGERLVSEAVAVIDAFPDVAAQL